MMQSWLSSAAMAFYSQKGWMICGDVDEPAVIIAMIAPRYFRCQRTVGPQPEADPAPIAGLGAVDHPRGGQRRLPPRFAGVLRPGLCQCPEFPPSTVVTAPRTESAGEVGSVVGSVALLKCRRVLLMCITSTWLRLHSPVDALRLEAWAG